MSSSFFYQSFNPTNIDENSDDLIDQLSSHFLRSITPSEGNSGDIVSLEGKFPPQGQFQIIFGTTKIEPALYFENKLQCVVPDGIPGTNVPVSLVFNGYSDFHYFHYKPQDITKFLALLNSVERTKGIIEIKRNKLPQEKESKLQRIEYELEAYEMILKNTRMYQIIPYLRIEEKLERFQNMINEICK